MGSSLEHVVKDYGCEVCLQMVLYVKANIIVYDGLFHMYTE